MTRFDVCLRTTSERFSAGFREVTDRFSFSLRWHKRFNVVFRETADRFSVALRSTSERFEADFTSIQPYADIPAYTGSYTFTPSQAMQVVPTAQKLVGGNITINPIPSNYGLITWNGAILTVS